jgi:hypothetical protein
MVFIRFSTSINKYSIVQHFGILCHIDMSKICQKSKKYVNV